MSMIKLLLAAKKSLAVTYATWNPSDKSANITLSSGNLVATATTTAWKSVRSTIGKSSGKWYREITIGATGTDFAIGVGNSSALLSNFCGSSVNGRSYYSHIGDAGSYYNNTLTSSYGGAAFGAGAVIGVMLDMTNGQISFTRNGVAQGIAYSGLSGTIFAMVSPYANGASYTANFGATTFAYSVPSGYNAGLYT